MFVQVTAKNVGGVFYETQCRTLICEITVSNNISKTDCVTHYYYSRESGSKCLYYVNEVSKSGDFTLLQLLK